VATQAVHQRRIIFVNEDIGLKKHTIYLIGVVIFAAFYEFLKARLDIWVFVGLGLCYLITLNVIAHKFGKDKDSDNE